uniref:F-box domain-containing protein n=1 Tax=Chromera velia CCMP2878 TaxID=1169474 RepID=A0A0G4HZB4_9ALVE|eukprot:Cvel_9671.t1-p1 / transcript=Cvel_9671.t1 / gene=Cvel_9671 / organism=Chromera_velia_CCMP2878 / gene_product=hypothetical protein / transcript_product=hypothetical protein / location=Cvel_scaffold563:43304-44665(-) / protein_length=454 / sequence_SO=supercontig / SO=protein_coding / is_pseudo=false
MALQTSLLLNTPLFAPDQERRFTTSLVRDFSGPLELLSLSAVCKAFRLLCSSADLIRLVHAGKNRDPPDLRRPYEERHIADWNEAAREFGKLLTVRIERLEKAAGEGEEALEDVQTLTTVGRAMVKHYAPHGILGGYWAALPPGLPLLIQRAVGTWMRRSPQFAMWAARLLVDASFDRLADYEFYEGFDPSEFRRRNDTLPPPPADCLLLCVGRALRAPDGGRAASVLLTNLTMAERWASFSVGLAIAHRVHGGEKSVLAQSICHLLTNFESDCNTATEVLTVLCSVICDIHTAWTVVDAGLVPQIVQIWKNGKESPNAFLALVAGALLLELRSELHPTTGRDMTNGLNFQMGLNTSRAASARLVTELRAEGMWEGGDAGDLTGIPLTCAAIVSQLDSVREQKGLEPVQLIPYDREHPESLDTFSVCEEWRNSKIRMTTMVEHGTENAIVCKTD